MSEHTVAKVTISLSQELLEVADRLARERKVSRSRVIADLIEKEMKDQLRALMAEGYRESAQENRRLAQEAFPLASDVIMKTTTWEEPNDG
ncbi:MAG: ribbon-helix-helix protein, CopG family [Chloroflexi bacterium]|nr:ribbon-helix-helix protein, CopG family [Chloroflexota bacterium]